MSLTPSDLQFEAIRAIVRWYGDPRAPQVFYLAGYAGTGKSTVTNFAIQELKDRYGITKVRSAAYTGMAASVMRKKGVAGASTIHALIYIAQEDPETGQYKFSLNRIGPAADADLIVLDECSFVDTDMAADVQSFGKKILVMGDPGQLPPVRGQGAFTGREPNYFLREIHRQAENSPIIRLATLARNGEHIPIGDYGDGCHVKLLTLDTMDDVYRPQTQTIVGLHRVRWTITQRYRKRLGFEGEIPTAGEKIMNRKNDKELGIFNGQGGIMRADARQIDDNAFGFDVSLEDYPVPIKGIAVHPYLFRQHFTGPAPRPRIPRGMYEFDWDFCRTCHAMQGSEAPDCTVVDDSAAFRDDRDRWGYTALSRASECVTLLKRAA